MKYKKFVKQSTYMFEFDDTVFGTVWEFLSSLSDNSNSKLEDFPRRP